MTESSVLPKVDQARPLRVVHSDVDSWLPMPIPPDDVLQLPLCGEAVCWCSGC
jgi:hypothetical protein